MFQRKCVYLHHKLINQPTANGDDMKNNMKQLKEIAKRQGFKVFTGSEFTFFFIGSKIRVGKGCGPKVTEWRFLHELGHAELCNAKDRHHLLTLYRILGMPSYKPTAAFYRDYLKMEWKAWEQGAKIAKREGIRIDETGYWRHAKACYQTYVDNLKDVYEG